MCWMSARDASSAAKPAPLIAPASRKVGSARMSFYSTRVTREEEPFEFWLAVGSKFLAVPVTVFMFTMGLQMLEW